MLISDVEREVEFPFSDIFGHCYQGINHQCPTKDLFVFEDHNSVGCQKELSLIPFARLVLF